MAQKQATFLYQQKLDGTKVPYFIEFDVKTRQKTLDNNNYKLYDFYRPKLSDF